MRLANRALQQSKQLQRFEFDAQTYPIRRNLMIFSSIAIASTLVSLPDTGKYEVNLFILKGTIDNPAFLYFFVAVTCLYYLIWFYFHCQRQVIKNYDSIRRSFTASLTRVNAAEKFRFHAEKFEPKFSGSPTFTSLGGSPESDRMAANLPNHATRNHQQMVTALFENDDFIISKTAEGITIEYTHSCSTDDLVFLNTHIDHYWRTRKEEWFIAGLPILYSLASIFLISFHIYKL